MRTSCILDKNHMRSIVLEKKERRGDGWWWWVLHKRRTDSELRLNLDIMFVDLDTIDVTALAPAQA